MGHSIQSHEPFDSLAQTHTDVSDTMTITESIKLGHAYIVCSLWSHNISTYIVNIISKIRESQPNSE